MKKFPCGQYGKQQLTFFPAPFRPPLRAFAALVFPFQGEQVLICDIEDRGWCIPSGRVEPDETSCQAVMREAIEEGGISLGGCQYIGCYQIRDRDCSRNEVRWADCFAAEVIGWQDLPPGFESRGRKLVNLEQLPEIYHLWNPLTELVFNHAYEVVCRLRAI